MQLKDFAPISQVFIAANVLAVPTDLPVKTVAELVALAEAEPGKLSYGHAGVGTSQHLGAELFNTWRMSILHQCPIAAPRRSCRTCSPTESPCRSPIS